MGSDVILPAMSPDLNPKEHSWPKIDRLAVDHGFTCQDNLYQALDAGVQQDTPDQIEALTGNMARRVAAVIAKGFHAKH